MLLLVGCCPVLSDAFLCRLLDAESLAGHRAILRRDFGGPADYQDVGKLFSKCGRTGNRKVSDGLTRARRLFKKAVQQGRTERRGEAYFALYVEPLSAGRTPLADFFNSLLYSCLVGG
ncbi:hypothetical protein NITMOv2_3238 [Nitrospira moscoviensis]|uniref:Uncharacterized protein n=1 Tax=Nitrospira moscoviensis TaxID=42253 RepID=A0A0K2GF99_NITMO|nr:hypothetical protein NITMOv2_3238 [Nitrospira moscoviensis]